MLVRFAVGWAVSVALFLTLVAAFLIVLYRYIPPVSTLMLARYATMRPVEHIGSLEDLSPHLVATVIVSEERPLSIITASIEEPSSDQLSAEDGPSRALRPSPCRRSRTCPCGHKKSVIQEGAGNSAGGGYRSCLAKAPYCRGLSQYRRIGSGRRIQR